MPTNNVTCPFVAKHANDVIGILSGFDRLRLRGTLRSLYQPSVFQRYLQLCGVRCQGFKRYALQLTERIVQGAQHMAAQALRPWVYLDSTKASKESLAGHIARRDGVTRGLIAILRCVEPCQTYRLVGGRLVLAPAKCLHLYFYFAHPQFGFLHLRLQTWFPFQIEVCLNGREWLCRQLERAGVVFQGQDIYLAWVADLPRAQRLLDRQWQTRWSVPLQRLLGQCHPLHREICRPLAWQYYWTCCESEYATDLMFADPARLQALYPRLVQHALLSFGSRDVLRFLGRNVPLSGRSRFQGQVLTDLKSRPEGVRIKHRVERNSIKMYDKFGRGLRVETTINDCEAFQIFRHAQGQPQGPKAWRALRRGLVDLPRRAEISRAANQRYLLALSAVDQHTPLGELAARLCQRIRRQGRTYRALNPWSAQDAALLQIVSRGEFALSGLRNRQVREALYGAASDPQEKRRQAARVSRQLALLRAHGILKKIGRTHRYQLTAKGRILLTALAAARHASTEQLTKLAA